MDKHKLDRRTVLSVLNVGARLLVICLVVAAVVSFVNELTKTRYAALQAEEQARAMATVFGKEAVDFSEVGEGVYRISLDGAELGYCVQTVTAGFGGDMALTVGFDGAGAVVGVQILSHSETPGLGARVDDAAYLSQYIGKSGDLVLGEDVDAISGATISSRAVLNGVEAARALLDAYLAGGGAE